MIDLGNAEHRAALFRLAHRGALVHSQATADLARHLLAEGWVIQSRRLKEVALVDLGRQHLLPILDARCPGWRVLVEELALAGVPITPRAIAEYNKSAGSVNTHAGDLPRVLNRKTYNARFKAHSKATSSLLAAPGNDVVLTNDQGILLRTHAGAHLRVDGRVIDCDPIMDAMGAVYVSERMLLRDWSLAGALPCGVLTVENPASFHDLPVIPGVMLVLVEGWNTAAARALLSRLPSGLPLAHFGDFDPAGVQIYDHLCRFLGREIRMVLPDFAAEYVPTHALPLKVSRKSWTLAENAWTGTPVGGGEPGWMQILRSTSRWLEQESITLDLRLPFAIRACLGLSGGPA